MGSSLSPVATFADHLFQFRTESPWYLHSMVGSLVLVGSLRARINGHGGQNVLGLPLWNPALPSAKPTGSISFQER